MEQQQQQSATGQEAAAVSQDGASKAAENSAEGVVAQQDGSSSSAGPAGKDAAGKPSAPESGGATIGSNAAAAADHVTGSAAPSIAADAVTSGTASASGQAKSAEASTDGSAAAASVQAKPPSSSTTASSAPTAPTSASGNASNGMSSAATAAAAAATRSPVVRPPSIDQQLAAAANNAGNAASTANNATANATPTNPIAAGFLGGVGQQRNLGGATAMSSTNNNGNSHQPQNGASLNRYQPGIMSRTGASPYNSNSGNDTRSSGSASPYSSAANGNRIGASMAAGIPRPPGGSSPFTRFQYPMPNRTASPSNPPTAASPASANKDGSNGSGMAGNKPGSSAPASNASSSANPPARDPRIPNPVTERLLSHSPGGSAAPTPQSLPGANNANAPRDTSRTGGLASALAPGFPDKASGSGSQAQQAAQGQTQPNWRALLDRPPQGANQNASSAAAASAAAANAAEQAKKRRTNSTSAAVSPFAGGLSSMFGNQNRSPGGPGSGSHEGANRSAGGNGQPSRSVTASPSAPPSATAPGQQRSPNPPSRSSQFAMTIGERIQQQHQQRDSQSPQNPGQPGRPAANTHSPHSAAQQRPASHLQSYYPGSSYPQSGHQANRGTPASASPPPGAQPGSGTGTAPGSPQRKQASSTAFPFLYGGQRAGANEASRTSGGLGPAGGSASASASPGHRHSASTAATAATSNNASGQRQPQSHYRRVSMGASGRPQTVDNSSNFQAGLFRPPQSANHSRTASLNANLGAGASPSTQRGPGQGAPPVASRTGGAAAPLSGGANAGGAPWKGYPDYLLDRPKDPYLSRRDRDAIATKNAFAYASATSTAGPDAGTSLDPDRAAAAQGRSANSVSPALAKKEVSPNVQHAQAPANLPQQSGAGADVQPSALDPELTAHDGQQAGIKRKRSDFGENLPPNLAQGRTQQPQHQGIPHPQQQQQPAPQAMQAVTLQSHRGTTGPLFSAEDIKGAALRPPLMAVRSDLVVRALHKIASQQAQAQNNGTQPPVPPFLGRVVYDPFLDPADLLDGELLRQGVGGKVEIWLDAEWLQGEVWEAGAPSHPASSVPPSPDLADEDEAPDAAGQDETMESDGQQRSLPSKQPEDASPCWTLWDLPPLRNRKIWGTDVYTDDSDILAACIHSGWLRLGSTAPLFGAPQAEPTNKRKRRRKALKHRSLKITIVVAPKLIKYEGSLRAGVRSRSWGNGHDGVSYAIESVELIENALHRMPHSRLKQSASMSLATAKERCACSAGCDQTHRPPAYNRSIALGKALLQAG